MSTTLPRMSFGSWLGTSLERVAGVIVDDGVNFGDGQGAPEADVGHGVVGEPTRCESFRVVDAPKPKAGRAGYGVDGEPTEGEGT